VAVGASYVEGVMAFETEDNAVSFGSELTAIDIAKARAG
jgi:hypothetical protein